MDLIKLSDITVERVKSGEFKEVIPEFYELEGIIENNSGHINDPVIDHIFSVTTELDGLLKGVSKRVKKYLSQKVGSYTRKELLFFTTIFHDIGKKETLNKEGDTVTFPGHEEVGAEKLTKILPRFDLSENERGLVVQTIGNHGFFHNILDHSEDNPNEKANEFRRDHPNIFLEIVLLTKADILGGQLKERDLKKFNFKINFLNKIISEY